MKTYEELKNMGIDFSSLEKKRKILHSRQKKFNVIMIILIILAVVPFLLPISPKFNSSNKGVFIAIGIELIAIMSIFFVRKIMKSRVYRPVKSMIMNDFFRKLNMDLVYGDMSKSRKIKKNFRKADFTSNGSIKIEDIISGSINGVPFVMGDVKETHTYRTDGEPLTIILFQGLFGFIHISRNYPYIAIIPNNAEKRFRGLDKLSPKEEHSLRINLSKLKQQKNYFKEDPDFEKHYVVWSKPGSFPKNIVTVPLREYLKAMASTNNVYVGFSNNTIMVGIDMRRDLFRLTLNKPINDTELSLMYDDFIKSYQFIENIYSLITTANISTDGTN